MSYFCDIAEEKNLLSVNQWLLVRAQGVLEADSSGSDDKLRIRSMMSELR